MSGFFIRFTYVFSILALVFVATCGKDSPTEPKPPEPSPPPAPVATRIEITPADVMLNAIGETVQLVAKVYDQNSNLMSGAVVTWSSNDIGVATVNDQGLVTAVKNGVARVTATSGTTSSGIEVTVVQTAVSIAIEPQEATLTSIGSTVQLTVIVLDNNGQTVPDAIVTWASSDETVATVSSEGLVTAAKAGVAFIKASVGDLFNRVTITVEITENTDRETLISLYSQLNGPNWLNSTNWLSDNPVDSWFGVGTNEEGRVISLALIGNQLSGSIPSEIGQLGELQLLDLRKNEGLSGPVPNEITNLSKLTQLFLDGTNLCVPEEPVFEEFLQNLVRYSANGCLSSNTERDFLIKLYNQTNGDNWKHNTNWLSNKPIGEWYGVLTWSQNIRVTHLQLDNNNLSGPIPPEIGILDSLNTLTLFRNQLSGVIPTEIGKLKNLNYLNLFSNQLTGPIPPEIGNLVSLDELWLASNQLTGSIPPEIGNLGNLRILEIDSNELNGPIPAEIGRLTKLEEINLGSNELSGSIPPEIGQMKALRRLRIYGTKLSGSIPPEIGQLDKLESLIIPENELSGSIPPEISQLSSLHTIWAFSNQLTGVPPEIGRLDNLRVMALYNNRLTGEIPAEILQMRNLEGLNLSQNQLTGKIPSAIGQLESLEALNLFENQLTGPIPAEIGQLADLVILRAHENQLTGPIPAEIGQLARLDILLLNNNHLAGMLPPEMGKMESLRNLDLSGNENLEGPLPAEFANLHSLDKLILNDTQLCAPMGSITDGFLNSLGIARVARCVRPSLSTVFLTQVTRPVPLVEGEDALLRVFVVAEENVDANMPQVRATFYRDDDVSHVVEIRAQDAKLPSFLDEGSLSASANEIIPGSVVRRGLELVVDIDPGGTLDPSTGVPARIPDSGRIAVAVQDVPPLELTLVPFVWTKDSDHSLVMMAEGLTEEDDLFRFTRDLLPVREFRLSVYDPVFTSVDPVSDNGLELLQEVEAIQRTDGRGGHYMGIIKGRSGRAIGGSAVTISGLVAETIAHELGHNMSLVHAPCGTSTQVDAYYPYPEGNIGAWGYDIMSNEMVSPDTPDLMSYCGPPDWISDYFYSKAIRYRQTESYRKRVAPAPSAVATQSLLLWGGVNGSGEIVLNPVFVLDAGPSVPRGLGPYRIEGETADGAVLFSGSFEMGEVYDGEGGVFAFTIPVERSWQGRLDRILLSGPEGFAIQDSSGDTAMALLRDRSTGRVRGFLRDIPTTFSGDVFARPSPPESGLEMVISRGIPSPPDWRLTNRIYRLTR